MNNDVTHDESTPHKNIVYTTGSNEFVFPGSLEGNREANNKAVRKASEIHTDITQPIIEIGEYKLRLTLIKFLNDYNKTIVSRGDWFAPVSVIITCVAVFASTDFSNARVLTSEFWMIFFCVLLIIAVVILVFSIIKILKSKKSDVIEEIINALKPNNNDIS